MTVICRLRPWSKVHDDKMSRLVPWLLILLAATGCRESRSSSSDTPSAPETSATAPDTPSDAGTTDGAHSVDAVATTPTELTTHVDVETVFRVKESPIADSVKIFLVAGSSQNANFAQEVIEQRTLWLDAGFNASEIACYYVIPLQSELDSDRAQYLTLAPALTDCYPASAKLLREHLAATANGPFLYLYVTAHGQRPVSLRLAELSPGDDGYDTRRRELAYPVFEQYRIVFEALPDGNAFESELRGAYRAGVDPRDLYFTSTFLAQYLADSYPKVPKYVVLQGCFSGGFIADARAGAEVPEPRLEALSQITVLTAARYDRESFGCGHDDRTTYYGGAFNQVLAQRLASPLRIDWRAIHEDVRTRVNALEAELPVQPSLPAFFTDGGR